MENQGFEEEQQSREISNADTHVYEDILPGTEDTPSRLSNENRAQRSLVSERGRGTSTRSLDRREEIAGVFERNSTLPFRRSAGLDPSTATSSSVRVTNRKRNNGCREDTDVAWNTFVDDALSSPARSTALHTDSRRPNRRRRKKDCKHCRSKVAAFIDGEQRQVGERENETVLRKNRDNEQQQRLQVSNDPQTILDPRNFTMLPACSPNELTGNDSSSVFTISEKIGDGSPVNLIERNDGCANLANPAVINGDNNALIRSEKSRLSLRVNSIYSQERWYAKGASIFCTDVKQHGTFQRAYSLPARTHTPSSQNRINLRRCVRREPPPHPARLRKHRHGWTLHLEHPLEASKCTKSLVLLIVLLLGVGAIALYIALEPEKLHVIQQYLKSSTNNSSSNNNIEHQNETTITTSSTKPPQFSPAISTPSILLNGNSSFPESYTQLTSETEAEVTSPIESNFNSTRYCDDCLPKEVCVALVDEEVPICRIPNDPKDPTGCAGFCLINKQKCHRLDTDAFRCVEMEHYCLDNEWACLNTLCIPLEKHCDGHMNCYDHSDEYNCDCDLQTHFQCGNETSCLPLERRCDGKIDCWDAADEINCTLGKICRVLRKTSSRAAMDSAYQKLASAIAYQTVSMDLTSLMDAKDGAINTNSHAKTIDALQKE
ncbi:uncharacterized protein LOC107994415 isoform X4 [Apis cerana]|uniref:uncharacterized protein LOC107994415 isoform X4 n=1 Tax=Apis cerana TaxID=7461 RepID=UPI002B23299F|nr:uncharacterized protein LOC107994415 isoform X4 [Apis cerana]